MAVDPRGNPHPDSRSFAAGPIDGVLRHVRLDIGRRGLPPEWLSRPVEHVPADVRDGELCDPQLLLQLPDEATEVELVSHVDAYSRFLEPG